MLLLLIMCNFIGMAKSALEAINGCNLFGEKGASWSVVYVDIDAHNRNRSIFETMLPRESSSKVRTLIRLIIVYIYLLPLAIASIVPMMNYYLIPPAYRAWMLPSC